MAPDTAGVPDRLGEVCELPKLSTAEGDLSCGAANRPWPGKGRVKAEKCWGKNTVENGPGLCGLELPASFLVARKIENLRCRGLELSWVRRFTIEKALSMTLPEENPWKECGPSPWE